MSKFIHYIHMQSFLLFEILTQFPTFTSSFQLKFYLEIEMAFENSDKIKVF